jgi:hypothetical protein
MSSEKVADAQHKEKPTSSTQAYLDLLKEPNDYVIIPSNAASTPSKPEKFSKEQDQLKTLQNAVGGYIELVQLTGNISMYVNEEGLLQKLPKNEVGTALRNMCCGVTLWPIYGDVVLVYEELENDE